MLKLTIEDRDSGSSARTGTLTLPHGSLEVPAFMPVGTNGTVKAVHHETLDEMGIRLILGNTYHLYLRPGMDVIKSFGDLHRFSSWKHNILTDSGGFQVFSLAPFRKIKEEGVYFRSHIDGSYHTLTPESVVEVQKSLGSDIMMQLDVCTPPEIEYRKALEALELTTRWGRRCRDAWQEARVKGYQGNLFGIVQGNFYEDLRRRSAEEIIELDLPGIAIGGLSVGESEDVFKHYLALTAELLPPAKPRYVMGIGTPEYIFEAVENGIDLFDCVFPTRVARNGAVFTRHGLLPLKKVRFAMDHEPIEPGCTCHACRNYSRGYLRHLFKAKEILGPMLATEHNLFFLHRLMESIRESIRADDFGAFKRRFLSDYTQGGAQRGE